jgi:hypothetical protein
MAIPAVMVPEEFNLVINPLDNAFAEMKNNSLFREVYCSHR